MAEPAPEESDLPPDRFSNITLAQVLLLVTAILGVINLFFGFTTVASGGEEPVSYFDNYGMFAWVPALLFLGGLTALRALLPGERHDGSLALMVTAAVVIPFIFVTIRTDRGELGMGTGEVLFLIFGSLQLLMAALAVALGSLRTGRMTIWQVAPAPRRRMGRMTISQVAPAPRRTKKSAGETETTGETKAPGETKTSETKVFGREKLTGGKKPSGEEKSSGDT